MTRPSRMVLLDRMAVEVHGPIGAVTAQLLDDMRLVLEQHLTTVSVALHDQFGEAWGLTILVVDE